MYLQNPAAGSESGNLSFVSTASDPYLTQLSTATEKDTTMRVAGLGLSCILMTKVSSLADSDATRKSL